MNPAFTRKVERVASNDILFAITQRRAGINTFMSTHEARWGETYLLALVQGSFRFDHEAGSMGKVTPRVHRMVEVRFLPIST